MDPNTSQPQDQNNGVPIPIPMPPQYQAAGQPGPVPQQQGSAPVPGWFAEAPTPGEEPPQRDRSPVPVGRILKILTFVILILGIVGGVGYGLITIFGVKDQETDRLATAQEAFNEEVKKVVYTGDGSDIERTADPEVGYGCPTGYDKTSSGKSCVSLDKIVATISTYTCQSGYSKTGSDANPECSKIVGGKKETKAAAKVVKCADSYIAAGNNCTKTSKNAPAKVYSCPSGYTKVGNDANTTCTKSVVVTGAVIASCAKTFTLNGTGTGATCTSTTAGTQERVYSASSCSAGYSRINDICSTPAKVNTVYRPNCAPPYKPYGGNLCSFVVSMLKKTVAGTPYCTGGTTKVSHNPPCRKVVWKAWDRFGDCPAGWNRAAGRHLAGHDCWVYAYSKMFTPTRTQVVCPSSTAAYSVTKIDANNCRRTLKHTPTTQVISRTCAKGDSLVESKLTGGKSSIWICTYKTTKYTFKTNCKAGSPVGTNCVQRGSVTLSCKAGLNKAGSGSGTFCTKKNTGTGKVNVTVKCEEGAADKEGQCTKVTTKSPTISYTCDANYKVSGSKCTRTIGGTKVSGKVSTKQICRDGYKLEGSGSKAKCVLQREATVGLQKIYTCKDGWKQMITRKEVKCVLVAAPAAE